MKNAGSSNPFVWVHYLGACPERSRGDKQGNRVKKVVNKSGNIQEVTVYIDGIYEYSYTKNSGTVDNNRKYNTLHIMDPSTGTGQGGNTRVGTQRTGNDADDSTPAQKYFVEDHTSAPLSTGLGSCSVTVRTNGGRINMEETQVMHSWELCIAKGPREAHPFGQTSFGSIAKKRYRYNGKEKDEHTGLYEYGQRYYAPWLCRFVSVDPIAEKFADLSSYNYAGNRPITKRDQEGLQEEGRKESPEGDRGPIKGNEYGFLLPEITVHGNNDITYENSLSVGTSDAALPLIEETGKKVLDKIADRRVQQNIENGIRSDNNGNPQKVKESKNSMEKKMRGESGWNNKGYFDAHRNQFVTTTDQGFETKDIRDFRNQGKFLLEGFGLVLDAFDLFQSVKTGSSPMVALPLVGPAASVHEEIMREYEYDNLELALSQDYETMTRLINENEKLQSLLGNYSFKRVSDRGLQVILSNSEFTSEFVDDIPANDDWKHSVLFIENKDDPGSFVPFKFFLNIR